MSIPNIPSFRDFLSSVSRHNPGLLDYKSIQIRDEVTAKMVDGRTVKKAPLHLWYKTDVGVTIDGVITKVVKELDLVRHPYNEQIAKIVLLLFTFHPDQQIDGVKALTEVIDLTTMSEISQFYILRDLISEDFEPVFFGDFSFEIMDPKRLAYKCEKAGSDYFKLYENSLVRRPWIARKKFSGVIINWHFFLDRVKRDYHLEFLEMVVYYFEAVAASLFEDFWFNFNEQQNLYISLGIGNIQDRLFREILLSNAITIFQDIVVDGKRMGYVVPVQVGNFWVSMPSDLGRRVAQLSEELREGYTFPGPASGETFETIKTFTKFIAKGYRYLDENKKDDGFLHFVIALDLLFGDKQESTKTVSNRCSLLTHAKLKRNYYEQKRILAVIYDLRSKYVHAGLSIQDKYLNEIEPICREVLYCLLRLHKNSVRKETQLTIELWKKKLDFAWSAIEANETWPPGLNLEIGLSAE